MSLRMVLSSTDSLEYFVDNKPHCFTVQLNKQIHLDGYWVVAMTECSTKSRKDSDKITEMYVCCEICQETFVGGKEMPLLRRVYLGKQKESNTIYTLPYYIPMKTNQLHQIRIYITDRVGNLVSFLDGPVNITLHFKKFPYVS